MKYLLILLSTTCFAGGPQYNLRIDFSTANMAITFPAGPQLAGPPNAFASVEVWNNTPVELEVNCSSLTKPSANAATSFYVQPYGVESPPYTSLVAVPYGKYCWARSVTTLGTSGVMVINAQGY